MQGLGITVQVDPVGAANLVRTTQLLNKTNQMNLSTRRLSDVEVTEWCASDSHAMWALTVGDKFGSAGLTGILSVEESDGACHVVDFVLSCRVMGRRIEHCMLHLAADWARSRDLRCMQLPYKRTAKNAPCHQLLIASELERDDSETQFWWDCASPFPAPAGIDISHVGAPGTTAVVA